MKPLVGSVCSGVGCIDLALERQGFSVAWQIEKDPRRRAVLRRHWPETPIQEDLCNATRLPAVHLIAGGTPCQDFSVAGPGDGLAGDRSGLFYEFIRLADEQPSAWILWENVPGVFSRNDGEDFAVCLEGFTGVRPEVPVGGWKNAGVAWGPLRWATWWCADAQYFGVPQRRRRLFVVAGPRGSCRPEVLLDGARVYRDIAPRQAPRAITSTLTSASSSGGGYRYSDAEADQLVVCQTLTSTGGRTVDRADGPVNVIVELCQLTHPENRSNPRPGSPAPTLTATGNLSVFPCLTKSAGGRCGNGVDHAVACSLGPRRLTPLEWERLQGVPDGWTEFDDGGRRISDSKRYEMVGDGAALPHVEWIAARLFRGIREAWS